MSVLTLLCFASVFYFALANPTVPLTPAEVTEDEIHYRVLALMEDMKKSINEHLIPIFGIMDEADIDYMENIALEGIYGYINFMLYLYEEVTPKMVEIRRSRQLIIDD